MLQCNIAGYRRRVVGFRVVESSVLPALTAVVFLAEGAVGVMVVWGSVAMQDRGSSLSSWRFAAGRTPSGMGA